MGFLSGLFRGRGYTTISGSQLQKMLNNSNNGDKNEEKPQEVPPKNKKTSAV